MQIPMALHPELHNLVTPVHRQSAVKLQHQTIFPSSALRPGYVQAAQTIGITKGGAMLQVTSLGTSFNIRMRCKR